MALPELQTKDLSRCYKDKVFADKRFSVMNIGASNVPVVIADLSKLKNIHPEELAAVGYKYDMFTDKWNLTDTAADYLFLEMIL